MTDADLPLDVRRGFHHTLEEIRQEMVHMAALVTEGIPRATETLLSQDLAEAQAIVDGDDPLDAKAVELEETCYQVLALQQPMASDLRSIVTAVRMIAEIERSGDLVVNIAKSARRILGNEIPARLRGLIGQMGEEATTLFRVAMDSYIDGDAALAEYDPARIVMAPGADGATAYELQIGPDFDADSAGARLAALREAGYSDARIVDGAL